MPLTAHPAVAAGEARSLLRTLNTGAIVVAALYFGQELLVPLTMAAILAFVLAPASRVMQRARLPRVVAVLVTVALAFVLVGGIGLVVGRQFRDVVSHLPEYQRTVIAKWQSITGGGGPLSGLLADIPTALGPAGDVSGAGLPFGLDPSTGLALARRVAQPLLSPLGTAAVVLVFTIFILLASEDLRDRLVRLVGRQGMHRTIVAMNEAARRLSRFFVFQLGLNSGFGLLIGLCLWAAGLPNPVLWGILAALMRFVPYVGTFIALLPPLLLAVAAVPGWGLAVVVLCLFIGCELAMGQIVEPLVYGHSTGLSPLAVIVATAFWALLWGPVGLLLATPLTLCLVVIGRNVEALAFLDIILGDQSPLDPEETFYQRALDGHAATLLASARRHAAASSLTDYYDRVALRGLAFAQVDLLHDELSFERLEAIHVQIEAFLQRIAVAAPKPADAPAPAWAAAGVIACIPGRGHLDDLAATMAVQVLQSAGFGAALVPNSSLGSAEAALPDAVLCCLSVLEEGSSVSAVRYLIRRARKRLPGATVVVCLWHADRESDTLAQLRSAEQGIHVVLSLGELIAYAQSLARRPVPLPQPRRDNLHSSDI